MKTAPQFLQEPAPSASLQAVHRPAQSSRRGELIAWLCTAGAGAGTYLLSLQAGRVPAVGVGLTAFFLLAGGMISFGQWVDRGTTLVLDNQAVAYRSPLRRVELRWIEVQQLWAVEVGSGWRVGVGGETEGFAFRTQATVGLSSMGSMAVGFAKGEQLAATIRNRAGLGPAEWQDGHWICRRRKPA